MNATLERRETEAAHTETVNLLAMGQAARAAGRRLGLLTTAEKNAALRLIAAELEVHKEEVLAANALDLADGRAKGLTPGLLDRLMLNAGRVDTLAADCRAVATLPDPVGAELESRLMPNGLRLSRRRIPIGVIGVIYEARPNVTIDIATLCLKTGNAAILRGGSETLRTNRALIAVIRQALEKAGVPAAAIQFIDSRERGLITELLRLDHYVDMIIPRGGAALHRLCREQATIPVITGGIGICHLYVDASADLARALPVIENAKVQRPSVCNALDTVLVHEAVAAEFLPQLGALMARRQVELRAEGAALQILQANCAVVTPAGPEDFDTEWMALILGVKVVSGLAEAVEHIYAHGSEHSDGILTNDLANATAFVNALSSSAVFVNASTRFNDGGQFGLGAEVAVSTQKLHARGPMGLEELTTYKWVAVGDYHIRP
jgi:glutamate-5-semialdehyde dehydrogenase